MRIIRKPVPQISTCKGCGSDFSYMRTLRPKLYCDSCIDGRKDKQLEDWKARKSIAMEHIE